MYFKFGNRLDNAMKNIRQIIIDEAKETAFDLISLMMQDIHTRFGDSYLNQTNYVETLKLKDYLATQEGRKPIKTKPQIDDGSDLPKISQILNVYDLSNFTCLENYLSRQSIIDSDDFKPEFEKLNLEWDFRRSGLSMRLTNFCKSYLPDFMQPKKEYSNMALKTGYQALYHFLAVQYFLLYLKDKTTFHNQYYLYAHKEPISCMTKKQ